MKFSDKLRIQMDGGIDYEYILQKGDMLEFERGSPLRICQWKGTAVKEVILTMGDSRGKLLKIIRNNKR